MKNLILILSIFIFSSCQFPGGTNSCISKLQGAHETVYSVNAFDYIVIDSNNVYHYISNHRGCSDNKYTVIKIK